MKILLQPAAGAAFVLAGDTRVESPEGIEVDGQRMVEIQQCAGADNSKPAARGNRQRAIAFKVTRKFESEIEAEIFFLKHEAEIPEDGTLEMRSGGEDAEQSIWFLDAVLTGAKSRHVGVSVFHEYSLVAGQLSATQPT